MFFVYFISSFVVVELLDHDDVFCVLCVMCFTDDAILVDFGLKTVESIFMFFKNIVRVERHNSNSRIYIVSCIFEMRI